MCLFIPNFVLFLIISHRDGLFLKCSYCSTCDGLEGTKGSRRRTKQRDERNENRSEGKTKISPSAFFCIPVISVLLRLVLCIAKKKRLCCSMETERFSELILIFTSHIFVSPFTFSHLHGFFPVKMLFYEGQSLNKCW